MLSSVSNLEIFPFENRNITLYMNESTCIGKVLYILCAEDFEGKQTMNTNLDIFPWIELKNIEYYSEYTHGRKTVAILVESLVFTTDAQW